MQCLPRVCPFRQKAGDRHSEPLIGSQTGSLFFAHKWPRHHGGLCSESGSVVCCPRRPRPAATASFALRTLFARWRTPRHHCASKSSELPWHTGLPTTVRSLAPRTSWVRSILGDALLRIPLFLSGEPPPGMPREVYLRVMQAHRKEFSEAVDGAAEPDSIEEALSALTEAGARLYLVNASHQPLVLLHTVTVSAALRPLLPHLPSELNKTALAYVWQNIAATAAAYADIRPP